MNRKIRKNKSGFTLAELLIATFILSVAFVGMLVTFLECMKLNDLSRNTSNALLAAKSRMEAVKNTQFDQIAATYHNVPFATPAGLTGMGVSYVDSSNPNLLKITISVCWRQKNGLIIGEDKNLNGALNGGEDTNGNGMIDSQVELVTNIYDE